MPPRRSARVAEAADRVSSVLWPLPIPLALQILALVPASDRLRCAEVSRAWRDAVATPSLWWHLDLTSWGGMPQHFSPALLRVAAAKARGGLLTLRTEPDACRHPLLTPGSTLLELLRENPSLTELRLIPSRRVVMPLDVRHHLSAVLRTAPQLKALHVHAYLSQAAHPHLLPLLCNQAPYSAFSCTRFLWTSSQTTLTR